MNHLTNISYYIAYATGYAAGNFVGIYIEEKMAIGSVIIKIITDKDCKELVKQLRDRNYGVTCFTGEGSAGNVRLIYTTVDRKDIKNVEEIVNKFNKHTFMSIEDIKCVKNGIFPNCKHDTISSLIIKHRHRH